jgi:hypothetical protein
MTKHQNIVDILNAKSSANASRVCATERLISGVALSSDLFPTLGSLLESLNG